MKISPRQEWKLTHIMALALIVMAIWFASSAFLLAFDSFFGDTIYYLFIVPYVLTGTPDELTRINGFLSLLVMYSFFVALTTAFVSKRKVISLSYIGLYIVLGVVFDKLFGYLF